MRKLTNSQLTKLDNLLQYTDVYEISIQFWPNQTAVFIEKDGVELQDYGGSFDHAIDSSLGYIKRITKQK